MLAAESPAAAVTYAERFEGWGKAKVLAKVIPLDDEVDQAAA